MGTAPSARPTEEEEYLPLEAQAVVGLLRMSKRCHEDEATALTYWDTTVHTAFDTLLWACRYRESWRGENLGFKQHGSEDLRAFVTLLDMLKPVQRTTKDVELLRQPFLRLICPAPETCLSWQSLETRTFWVQDSANSRARSWDHRTKRVRVSPTAPAVFYVHGGGFFSGDLAGYSGILCSLCRLFGPDTSVLFSEYRLAPEHSLEQSLEDVICALRFFQNSTSLLVKRRVLMADSAGCLHLLAALRILKEGGSMSDSVIPPVVLISPWVDLSLTAPSYSLNAERDCMFLPSTLVMARELATCRTHGNIPTSHWTPWSALYKLEDMCGIEALPLPPTLILTDNDELLRDDSIQLFACLRSLGCDATLDVEYSTFHIAPLLSGLIPEGQEQLLRIRGWLQKHWEPPQFPNKTTRRFTAIAELGNFNSSPVRERVAARRRQTLDVAYSHHGIYQRSAATSGYRQGQSLDGTLPQLGIHQH